MIRDGGSSLKLWWSQIVYNNLFQLKVKVKDWYKNIKLAPTN
jgi:hypothetical protein